jgi:hypothetical protein
MDPEQNLVLMDPDPGGPKTFESGSATLVQAFQKGTIGSTSNMTIFWGGGGVESTLLGNT